MRTSRAVRRGYCHHRGPDDTTATVYTAQLSHWRPLIITLVTALGLAEIALWPWTAPAVGQGRNWARILSTVLAGLATLQLIGTYGVAELFCAVPTWLTDLAAAWQLWRTASSAFFTSARTAQSRPPAIFRPLTSNHAASACDAEVSRETARRTARMLWHDAQRGPGW